MSSASPQPDHRGSLSPENAPQVVVRADKVYVCSACGTLVEIPADVVGQLVIPVAPSTQDEPAATAASSKASLPTESKQEADPNQALTEERPSQFVPPSSRPPRPRLPRRPKRNAFTGEIIDGLRVPSSHQLDRALAWVSFHLKVLDRQGSEIKRLQKLLKNRCSADRVAPNSPHSSAHDPPARDSIGPPDRTDQGPARADLNVASPCTQPKGREPP